MDHRFQPMQCIRRGRIAPRPACSLVSFLKGSNTGTMQSNGMEWKERQLPWHCNQPEPADQLPQTLFFEFITTRKSSDT